MPTPDPDAGADGYRDAIAMPDIPIDEFVVPIVEAVPDEPYARITRFRGTGFRFGPRGAVLTAEHVVRKPVDELAIATPNPDGGFRLWSLQGVEAHATDDVAVGVASLGDSLPESPLRITNEPQYGSASWMLWEGCVSRVSRRTTGSSAFAQRLEPPSGRHHRRLAAWSPFLLRT